MKLYRISELKEVSPVGFFKAYNRYKREGFASEDAFERYNNQAQTMFCEEGYLWVRRV